MNHTPNRQRGITLLVTLIMLVLMTLLVISSFKLGKSSLQVVGNMQSRNEATAAAQQVIEEAISTTRLFQSPLAVINPTSTDANCPKNTKCIDVNGDGTTDIKVVLATPSCTKAQPIQNSSLALTNAEDTGCSVGENQNLGILGANTGESLCADTLWEIKATATDQITKAEVTVSEGVAVRISSDNVSTNCL